ncbi:MAG: DNA-3-methyladenine glycosylase [Flavobacteriaceae bacterium]|nr:DNA-3-methyladenine glycosylase [Flavobacteriaceae bacterium]
MPQKLDSDFFCRESVIAAQELLGKSLVRVFDSGETKRFIITETEAYLGEEDLACHASKGRTPRTEVMYHAGGKIYVYLIYGMYRLLNFVTGEENHPQAVLIRGLEGCSGPGRVGKLLKLDKSFYGEDLTKSKRIWLEDIDLKPKFTATPRIGIDYAGEIWKNKLWRFVIK